MAEYSVRLSSSAQKELDELDDGLFDRIDRKILQLRGNPRPSGCKKLSGHKDVWRVRVGDWRVVYLVSDSTKQVTITRVAHRSDAYR